MAYVQKDMSGSLFANKEKTTDTQANAKGSAVIDGIHYFVDAWTNTTPGGDKYQALKFKRKDKQPTDQAAPAARQAAPAKRPLAEEDSDIPW